MNKKNIETIYSLSSAQQGMLYDTISTPGSGIYIEQFICTLTGNLDQAAFRRAWQWEVNRHDILRTCFVWETQTEPLQVVLRQLVMPFEQQDWRELSPLDQSRQLEVYIEQDRQRGFQLSHAPLMRVALFQTDEDTYQFVWTHHHILIDGWCCNLVLKEVLSCYQAFSDGQAFALDGSRPFRDYIAWLKRQDLTKAEQFWRKNLRGFTQPTSFGIVAEPSDLSEEGEGFASQQKYLSATTTAALQLLAGQHRLTMNTLLQGTWALLLSRYSGTEDVLFGITVSGRPAELAGIEKMIGLCINTLPVRVQLTPEATLWPWLDAIQAYNLELRQYEYSPAGHVHQWSNVAGGHLLYESLLVVENYPMDLSLLHSSTLPIALSNIRSQGAQTKYALTILVTLGTELGIVCIYDTQRFARQAIAQILEHFQTVLERIATHPQQHLASLRNLIPAHQIPIVRPLQRRDHVEREIAGARNPLEEVLVEIWMEVLGSQQVGIHDNFFDLGGHSLLATQLASRIRTIFQVELRLGVLFESPTVAKLAERIALMLGTSQSLTVAPVVAIARDRELPLSFAQQRLWFLHQLMPDTTSYSISRPMRIHGLLNVEALQRSLAEIIRRHEVLRTTFTTQDGRPIQIISPSFSLPLPVIDLRSFPESEREVEALRLIRQEVHRRFDLAQGPLIRVTLLQLGNENHILLLMIHHIAFDAWSEGIFIRELITLYEVFSTGKPSPLAELPLQYADFAIWQREWLQGEALKAQVAYWKKQLHGVQPLKLPTDHPQPTLSSYQGAIASYALSAELSEALVTFSRREGVTLFMTLLTAFQTLLHRYSGQDDIVVGTDIANRTRSECEMLIGFFVNLLVLRTDLSGTPRFRVLLQHVREMVLSAYAYQDLPFEKLVEALQMERVFNRTPLVRALFVLQNTLLPSLNIQGLTISPIQMEMTTTNFDLAIFTWTGPHGLMVGVNYCSDLFEPTTISNMLKHFEVLLQSIVAHPDAQIDDLEIYTAEEKHQRLSEETLRRETRRRQLHIARRDEVNLSESGPV